MTVHHKLQCKMLVTNMLSIKTIANPTWCCVPSTILSAFHLILTVDTITIISISQKRNCDTDRLSHLPKTTEQVVAE